MKTAVPRARRPLALVGLALGLLISIAPPAAALELEPFLSGLTNPLYLTHARDGSGRLFVVEQAGVVKVLAPGASTPSAFLDITDRVLAGGERGLLGLAFHPQYPDNGRFFVHYTRKPDGAIVVAEYHRSSDPSIASTAETVLLTIPHPTFANHNGGMVEFGPDGFLYIAAGDGGSANDPPNNAQRTNVLLGKILRIDVDSTTGGLPYGIPPDNPFVGVSNARPEIYAFGLRNPFRFSFDRLTGQLLAADVGQGAWEEIDVITRGGNYGWRVFEGNHCTNNDPALCVGVTFVPPIVEYSHSGGRCSVIGGYAYRGARGTLAPGTYVFGDLCTGEIFAPSGGGVAVLLDTSLAISSFGEDEAGELYVVNLGGTVQRLIGDPQTSLVAAVLPTSRSVTVGTPATAFATIVNTGGTPATGCGISLATPVAASFSYQTTDPTTNAVTGAANAPANIAAGASQSFVFAITPSAPVPPTSVVFAFQCLNSPVAPLFEGVNTLLFSAEAGPVPDLVALVAFRAGSDGVVNVPGATGTDLVGVASINVGAGAPITVTLDTGGVALPLVLSICRTDAQGACLAPPAASLSLDIASGATPSFAVFATGTGTIPFAPETNRIYARFRDASGATRGATSAAVRTR
ncbi:MAG TPA: PQQ-dependent sugar dehydrogenase [Methylomirabilota bacterium]|jgi:hypothetical protein|nr:PQQ-dependent sugar dehydrogenase [Methylomirabilota bacterium]